MYTVVGAVNSTAYATGFRFMNLTVDSFQADAASGSARANYYWVAVGS